MIPITKPSLRGRELEYVSDCITSTWISRGKYVEYFEQVLRDYLGVRFALSTSSGTTALHLALVALGIGPGDEVIVPNLTFAATANVVMHCGAKPVLVDVDKDTWTLDPVAMEAKLTRRTRAVMPVHLYGHPCDMDPILDCAAHHNLFVVEDAAEALGAEDKGRKVGGLGDIGCFSFFANKVITTGEGGMVVTNDLRLYERMLLLRNQGMAPDKRYWHLEPGFNYRLTNLQAAVGLAQMECLAELLRHRQRVAACYACNLGNIEGVTLPPRAWWAKNIYWLYSILVPERDRLAAALASQDIETRPFFYPLHIQPPYLDAGEYPVSSWLSKHGLSLPTFSGMRSSDIDLVCGIIEGHV